MNDSEKMCLENYIKQASLGYCTSTIGMETLLVISKILLKEHNEKLETTELKKEIVESLV